jgi:arylsulfatase A-like enzyme
MTTKSLETESALEGSLVLFQSDLSRRAKIILYAAAGLAAFVWVTTPANAAEKKNVLFLIADDLNCDLGCYGHPLVRSPNIDRLAGRGLRFERVYCQFPLCCPSRASFMCGLYPDQTTIQTNGIYIRQRLPNVVTMSQMFKNHGYQAMRVGKIYHYGVPTAIGTDGHDDPASWDKVVNPRGRDKDEESQIFSLLPGRFGGTLSWLAAEGSDEEQTDGVGAGEAIKLLQQFAANKQPFFLAVGFYRPHTPYVAPKKYFDLYPREKIVVPAVPAGYLQTLPEPARATLTAKKDQVNLPVDTARKAMQAYYASITFMDAQVGRVLEALDRLGLSENTVVLFTSDHGYHMGEHGYYQKQTLFENAARVPLVIAAPGLKTAGKSTASLAEMVDFYPTLAEVCGLRAPGHLSGVSLAAVLDDRNAAPRATALTRHADGYTLRTDRYRYTEWGAEGSDGAELYDHQTDPAEMVNVAGKTEHAKTVAQLSKVLRERIAGARKAPPGVTQLPPDPQKPQARRLKRRAAATAGAQE